MQRPFFALLISAIAGSTIANSASASPIMFTHTGSGSGSLGGVPFSNAAFVITATGDTANRVPSGNAYIIVHDTASISIDGVGTVSFVTSTSTAVNHGFQEAVFGNLGAGLALITGPVHSSLASWDMLSSIGPINGSVNLLQWNFSPVITTGGDLLFNNSSVAGSFQAVVVPAPAPLGAIVGVALLGRRRRARVGG